MNIVAVIPILLKPSKNSRLRLKNEKRNCSIEKIKLLYSIRSKQFTPKEPPQKMALFYITSIPLKTRAIPIHFETALYIFYISILSVTLRLQVFQHQQFYHLRESDKNKGRSLKPEALTAWMKPQHQIHKLYGLRYLLKRIPSY